jgi:hypothetical protein
VICKACLEHGLAYGYTVHVLNFVTALFVVTESKGRLSSSYYTRILQIFASILTFALRSLFE